MNDTPTAVISGASRGALRSGLYATRSIAALIQREHGIMIDERQEHPADDRRALESVSRPSTVMMQRARDEPGQREDVAVGEVDQLEDAVDERVAERDDP